MKALFEPAHQQRKYVVHEATPATYGSNISVVVRVNKNS